MPRGSTASPPAASRWAPRSRCASRSAIPGRVDGLVLVRPAWAVRPGAGQPRDRSPRPRRLLLGAHAPDAARARFAASPTAARLAARGAGQPRLAARLLRPPGRRGLRRRPRRYRRRRARRLGEARRRRSTVPTLVIGNAADAVHPLGLAREPRRRHPGRALRRGDAQGRPTRPRNAGGDPRGDRPVPRDAAATEREGSHDLARRRRRSPRCRATACWRSSRCGRPTSPASRRELAAHRAASPTCYHVDVADGRLRAVLPVLPRPRRADRAS